MRTIPPILSLVLLALPMLGCGAPQEPSPRAASAAEPREQTPAPPRVALLRVPEHGIQPCAAIDDDGGLHLIYFQGDPKAGDIFYVRKPAGAEKFSPPLRVNSQPGSAIAVGTIRGAQLALGKNGRVHVAWNGSSKAEPRDAARKNGTPMLYARLNDDGDAFEPQRNLIHEAYGLDGGGTLAADDRGNVYVAWHAQGDAQGEQNRRVYLAVSRDGGRTFAPEAPVFDEPTGACGCCGMGAFADRRGNVYLLYRAAKQRVHRDMYLLVSRDGGRAFSGGAIDDWKIAACPMSSQTFAAGPRGVAAGWETAGEVFWTPLQDGKPQTIRLPRRQGENAKHPRLAINAQGQTLLVWTEGTGWNRGGSVAWQVYDTSGHPTAAKGRQTGVPTWSLATAFITPDGGFGIVY